MTTKKTFVAAIALLILGASLPQLASAHSLWINSTDHSPAFFQKFGAQTKTYIGFGHRYPVDDFLPVESIKEYILIGPGGKKTEITPVNLSGFLESEIRMKDVGQYIVALSTKPGFYTMYADGGRIHHKMGPKTGLNNIVVSLYYEQFAKSLIIAGGAEGEDYKKPVGHKLEIIPMENPLNLKGGGADTLTVKILLDGRPASFCKVYATHSGFSAEDDFACATVANGEGLAKIRLTHWGPWLIKANHRIPSPDNLKEQCNELNYTATLTLSIP